MSLPFRQQILDLKLIESVDEQELTLEESDKILGGIHYTVSKHPPIQDLPGISMIYHLGIYKYYTTFVNK